MGTSLSRPCVTFDCYEVAHTWTPFCHSAAVGVGLSSFEEGLKIYSSLYFISSLLGGRLPVAGALKKTLINILRSTIFLACNSYFFMIFTCVCRKLAGGYAISTPAVLPSFLANYLAIFVESSNRRSALALYFTNVASETLFNMFVARQWIRPIKNGKMIIFALTLAALFRWFRTTKDVKSFQHNLIKALVGDQERKPVPESTTSKSSINNKSSILNARHTLCPHKQGCFKYSLQIIAKNFTYGWGLHAGVSLALSLPLLLRKPAQFVRSLTQVKHIHFGAFIATLAGVYRSVHCALRWIRSSNSNKHSIVAGLLAGTSIAFYPNTTVLLYIAWKTLETLYLEGISHGVLPEVPGFPAFLYSLSTAVVFHAAVLEPHNLKPAYWKFLMRITGNRIGEINRKILDVMGMESSRMLPNFRPCYDQEYISEELKSWLELHQQQGSSDI